MNKEGKLVRELLFDKRIWEIRISGDGKIYEAVGNGIVGFKYNNKS
jgi:hypothetical protein